VSLTAGVKSEKPPVHLGKPGTGCPVLPSQAWSAAESVGAMMSGTPSPETSASAGAVMKPSPWIGCENCDRLWPVDGSQTPTPECTRIPMPGVSTTPVATYEAEDPDWAISGAPPPSRTPADGEVVNGTIAPPSASEASANCRVARVRRSTRYCPNRLTVTTATGPVGRS